MNITQAKFDRYCRLQAIGDYNMFSSEVEDAADITREEKIEIMKNYGHYVDIYSNLCSYYCEMLNNDLVDAYELYCGMPYDSDE